MPLFGLEIAGAGIALTVSPTYKFIKDRFDVDKKIAEAEERLDEVWEWLCLHQKAEPDSLDYIPPESNLAIAYSGLMKGYKEVNGELTAFKAQRIEEADRSSWYTIRPRVFLMRQIEGGEIVVSIHSLHFKAKHLSQSIQQHNSGLEVKVEKQVYQMSGADSKLSRPGFWKQVVMSGGAVPSSKRQDQWVPLVLNQSKGIPTPSYSSMSYSFPVAEDSEEETQSDEDSLAVTTQTSQATNPSSPAGRQLQSLLRSYSTSPLRPQLIAVHIFPDNIVDHDNVLQHLQNDPNGMVSYSHFLEQVNHFITTVIELQDRTTTA
ncbi:hypothetical protein DL96DRAFT_1609604 [Flagelloscypha sp. PMI_526]|nr:hypothetical protein DL96DRAFT_1609604 [Flagelloscypha sp. PMI_526]